LQCALWGFNGGNTEFGNPYLAIQVDVLHQTDVGIFKMLIGILRCMASDGDLTYSKAMKELDRRLLVIKKEARHAHYRYSFVGFNLFSISILWLLDLIIICSQSQRYGFS